MILILVFICALGASTGTRHGRCPPNHTQQMMTCIEPIRRMQSNPSQNRPRQCRTINRGLDCLERIMERCPSQPDVTAMASMLNIDQLRTLVNSQCSGGPQPTFQPGSNNNCPPGYSERILSCVRPMQNVGQVTSQNVVQACGVAVTGLECLDSILNNCAGQPDVQALTSMLNIDTMRNMVQAQCSRIGAGSSNNNDNCPSGYSDRMMRCLEPMTQLETIVEQDINLACSVATDGIGCLDEIVNNCGDKPEVNAVVDMLELDDMRTMIQSMCSGSGPNTGNGDSDTNQGTEDNCPAGYALRLRECAEPMQNLGTASPQNLNHACSVAEDGIGCLQTIMTNCPNKPEVQALSGMLNIDELRSMISSTCSGCADSTARLQRCNEILSLFNDDSSNLNIRCRNVYRGFDCFRDLISRCPNDPAVSAFTSMIDIEEASQSMGSYCPRK